MALGSIDKFYAGLLFQDRKSTRLNSSHLGISYAVFCLKKKMRAFARALATEPQTLPRMLCGLQLALARPTQIVIVPPPGAARARPPLAALHPPLVPARS